MAELSCKNVYNFFNNKKPINKIKQTWNYYINFFLFIML
jgi:hypothetical protein